MRLLPLLLVAFPLSAVAKDADRFDRPYLGMSVIELDTAREGLPKSARADLLAKLAAGGEENDDPLVAKLMKSVQGDALTIASDLPPDSSELPKAQKGVLVLHVAPNSPAEKAGIEPLDIVVRFEKTLIVDRDTWAESAASLEPKQVVTLEVAKPKGTKKPQWAPAKKLKIAVDSYRDFLTGSMTADVDDIEKLKYWRHLKTPKESADRSGLAIRFIQDGGKIGEPYLRVSYVGDGWVFFKQITLAIGERRYEFEEETTRKTLGGSRVAEWCGVPIGKKELEMLRSMAGSGNKMRLSGRDKLHDRVIPRAEVERILITLDAYELMGGKFE